MHSSTSGDPSSISSCSSPRMASASTLDNDAFASLLLSMRGAPMQAPLGAEVDSSTSASQRAGSGAAGSTHSLQATFFGSNEGPAVTDAAVGSDADEDEDDDEEQQLVRSILGGVAHATASVGSAAAAPYNSAPAPHVPQQAPLDESIDDGDAGGADGRNDDTALEAEAAEDDEMDAASILLRVSNSPALGPIPPPLRSGTKRPRMDSEYSLDTLSEIAAREAMLLADSDEDDEEEEEESDDAHTRASSRASASTSGAQNNEGAAASSADRRRPSSRSGGTAADANISLAAKDFFQRRRNGWAERTEAEARAHSALSLTVAGLACVLSPDQIETYNQASRVGVYLPMERGFILERYHSKRAARVWGKKIRYTCRKSLADRRVRVKGRFVKAEFAASIASKEITVAGAWVPAVRHEHRVERLLRERSMSEGGAAGRPREEPPSEKRLRRASISALEAEDAAMLREIEADDTHSPYAHRYVTSAASRNQRRERSVTLGAIAELAQPQHGRGAAAWPPAASGVPASSPLAREQEGSATKSALSRAVRSESVASGGGGKRSRTVSFHETA